MGYSLHVSKAFIKAQYEGMPLVILKEALREADDDMMELLDETIDFRDYRPSEREHGELRALQMALHELIVERESRPFDLTITVCCCREHALES